MFSPLEDTDNLHPQGVLAEHHEFRSALCSKNTVQM